MAATKAFFRSAKAVTGVTPACHDETVTTITHARSGLNWMRV